MCGISGLFSPNSNLPSEARARAQSMNLAMAYRGPDDDGVYENQGVVLGHRRLSIIDRAGGDQPMRTVDNRLAVVFNGEIYNFGPLRKELEALGHRFKTRSDTEVLLHGYRAWGEGLLERLRGMFAFALYDADKRTLFAARDPIGKKPFYYFENSGTFHFASDVNALRACGLMPDKLSPEALRLYFSLGYVPAPHCIYAGVRKLEAGHALRISVEGIRHWQFWDIQPEAAPGSVAVSENEALEKLSGLLDQGVARRLISEVPLGAFLSGGIDSNLVVASMARVSQDPVRAFTVGFKSQGRMSGIGDERQAAIKAAAYYGAQHQVLDLDEAEDDLLPRLMHPLGEPLADSSILPTYLICRAARREVTVALTGDGGDEPFGGYSARYLPYLMEQRLRRLLPEALLSPMASGLHALWPDSQSLPRPLRLKTVLRNLASDSIKAFYLDQSPLRCGEAALNPALRMGADPALDIMRALYQRTQGWDELNRALYVDTRLYMCENVLVKADRMSMANSLELRSPLLDQDLVSYAFTLPAALKISRGECKYLLRRLAEKKVEPSLLTQPKTGFAIPVDAYMRDKWRARVTAQLFGANTSSNTSSRSSPLEAYLDMDRLREIWRGFLAGDTKHAAFLWSAYVLSVWIQEFHAKPQGVYSPGP